MRTSKQRKNPSLTQTKRILTQCQVDPRNKELIAIQVLLDTASRNPRYLLEKIIELLTLHLKINVIPQTMIREIITLAALYLATMECNQ